MFDKSIASLIDSGLLTYQDSVISDDMSISEIRKKGLINNGKLRIKIKHADNECIDEVLIVIPKYISSESVRNIVEDFKDALTGKVKRIKEHNLKLGKTNAKLNKENQRLKQKEIKNNKDYKEYLELYNCLYRAVHKTVNYDTFEIIKDRAELLKLKSLFKEDK